MKIIILTIFHAQLTAPYFLFSFHKFWSNSSWAVEKARENKSLLIDFVSLFLFAMEESLFKSLKCFIRKSANLIQFHQ